MPSPPPPAKLAGGAVPRRGGGSLLPCGDGLARILPAQSVLILELLQGPFLRGSRCWCVRGANPVRKPVYRELGLVLGHGQVMSNDQVRNDFALAFKVGRLGHETLALIQRGLDLVANRYQCRKKNLGSAFKLSRARVTSLAHLTSNCAWVAVAMYV